MPIAVRQPNQTASVGSVEPDRKMPNMTPDCLSPVMVPRRPAGTRSAMSLLVAGLHQPCPRPANPADAMSTHRLVANAIPNMPIPAVAMVSTVDSLGPTRSVRRPDSGANSAATIVLAVSATLKAPVVICRAAMRSTAITAGSIIGIGPRIMVATSTKFRPRRCSGPSSAPEGTTASAAAPACTTGSPAVRIAANPMAARRLPFGVPSVPA